LTAEVGIQEGHSVISSGLKLSDMFRLISQPVNFLFLVLFTSSNSVYNIPAKDEIPAVYKKIYGATDLYIDGDYVVIKVTGRPDHKSPYYKDTKWEESLYERYTGSNPEFHLNPNRIVDHDVTFRIPVNPKMSEKHRPTPLGPIGVSLNGVPFYNQYSGQGQPLTREINSFDQYFGHPQQFGQYHYHAEPTYLTAKKGKEALLGFLLDGFPVYGPMESGKTVQNSELDAYHGHSHKTVDFPDGIYHYHITSDDPYINGSGFYGNAGTVSR
jgi:hypothetical protein